MARVAGLLAHIIEEYDYPPLYRLRVGYRGRVPFEIRLDPESDEKSP
jgi:citrate synthase